LEGSRANIKRVLEDLEQAKAWSETLIQSIVEGIVTFDDQGKITSFNQGAEYLTGWSQDEVLHQNLDEILRLSEEEGTISHQLPPSGGSRHIQIITRGGKQMTLAVTSSQLTPPKSDSPQSALVLRDITEIEAVRNLRSYFLANISHEFRTPLSAINASVELLLEELEDLSTAEIGELLNSIHMSVSGLQTLIDNLLESLSIEAGRFRIRRRSTDLNTVIQEAVRMMKPLLDRRQQKLSIQNPLQISKVNLDPSRLTQVITNLLSNASKYSPIGKEIDLVVEKLADDLVKISVVDRGPGIPPVERSDIFRRFVRLDSQEGTQYGVGLGLSVVKTIVEEHGGEIGIEDNPGGGSIFWFTLPF
jgi:PAS domain S-box-containing protein